MVNDAVILRTASSLEFSVIEVYDLALDSGLIPDATMADAARTFRDQHQEHADAVRSRSRRRPAARRSTEPNPVVQAGVIDPAVKLVADNGNKPEDVLFLVYGLEELAAETYQTFVQVFTEPATPLRHHVGGRRRGPPRRGARRGDPRLARHPGPRLPRPPTRRPRPPPRARTRRADRAPVYQVPGAFQPLTSVQVTIGIETINMDPLGPNSYMYEPAAG